MTEVPCAGCTVCCRTNVQIPVDERDHATVLALSPDGYLPRHANHDCVFLDRSAGCTIYNIRPKFCRSFDCRESLKLWPSIPNVRQLEIEAAVGKDMINELFDAARWLERDPQP